MSRFNKFVPRDPVVLTAGGIGTFVFCFNILVLDVLFYNIFANIAQSAHNRGVRNEYALSEQVAAR